MPVIERSQGMRHHYAARRDGSEVCRLTLDWDPDMADDFAFVKQVKTAPSYRGRGIASGLLRRACADADRSGVELQLYPDPLDRGMSREQLQAWYGRHGFSPEGMAAGYWRRRPNAS
jgi:ribosomal protein S18 acetylase RimI-like enzyme